MENTTPTTVMTAAAIAIRTCSASPLPVWIHEGRISGSWNAATSISNVTMNNRTDTTIKMLGTTHSVVRSSSQRQLGSWRRSLPTRAGCGGTTSSMSLMTARSIQDR